jgi:hypothetical protein
MHPQVEEQRTGAGRRRSPYACNRMCYIVGLLLLNHTYLARYY